jgi:hypothetical protein
MMENALDDLARPAPPRPLLVSRRPRSARVMLRAARPPDPRVRRIAIYVHHGSGRFGPGTPGATLVCRPVSGRCQDRRRSGAVRYAAVSIDRWGRSTPAYSKSVGGRR